ncbi:hypothetical protein JIG36_47105 [Actinoplanes sp. LDG1-06]|uniref:Uncharacterized protein n=1 Tax=Paractinoplanes ovalisporus TaxID=2810368 RepID=A0ABS2ATQ4_9ACTN|nr:hypothetical protein [Actinoplanes ovalisporus]
MASAALVLTAACGGGSGDASSDGDGANGGGQNSAFTAYTDCLKENGVTITMPSGGPREGGRPSGMPSGMPRPSGSAGPRGGGGFPGGGGMFGKPDDVDDATWQKAQEACSSLRPSGRPGGMGNGNRGNGQNAAYQNCLKENGVTDPATMDTSDATVKKAIETCKVLQPTAGATPSA